MFSPNSSQILLKVSFFPDYLINPLEKLACIPDPFQSPLTGFGCKLIAMLYFSPILSKR